MLAYAMTALFIASAAAVPFCIEMFLRRREPKYLYLLTFGWASYSTSLVAYGFGHAATHSPLPALFGALQLLGVSLVTAGVFSYFIRLPAKRIAVIAGLCAVGLFAMFYMQPGTLALVSPVEGMIMGGATLIGLSRPRRFMQVGGSSYFWLLGMSVIGTLAAAKWISYASVPTARAPVTPWLGTTATVIVAVLFMVHLEYNAALVVLRQRDAELSAYHESLEQLVHDRTAQLEEATKAKSEFLATMSHELRTPLNSIIGFSGILSQGLAGPLSPEQARQIAMVNRSGRHLLSLVNQVLDLAKIEAGRVELINEPLDPQELVEEISAMVRPLAQAKGLELRVDASDGSVLINSDLGKVKQILLNLLSNAIKFTDSGRVEIRCSQSPDGAARFAVIDTGIGIAEPDLPRVFEAFTQITTDDIAKPSGTGLGLSLSREFAHMLGGEISIESQVGIGSTFTLVVPDRV